MVRTASIFDQTPVFAPERLPVARPHMPAADAILPYLERIDASRQYSNFCPLVRQLKTGWWSVRS